MTSDFFRPKYHYTAEKGWINDPNGFSVYNGKYHLFAQHYPHDTKWGPMHWSHAVSEDLITWEHLPIALMPDRQYEMDLGCFSGTAVEHDGKHVLMYTACAGNNDEGMTQLQCLAVGDGVKYEKHESNPVINESHLPSFASAVDFRDPKVFKEGEWFYCLLGSKVVELNIGTLLLFKSKNLTDWQYVGESLRAPKDKSLGVMFECPDIFKMGDKYVILVSPMFLPKEENKYANVYSSIYMIGDLDLQTGKFNMEFYDEIDTGFDFYAPQTTKGLNGERVMVAWAQMWERNFVTDQLNQSFTGAMTIPRVISLKGNKLIQTPLKSLENYHKQRYEDVNSGSNNLFRLILDVNLSEGDKFELELLKTITGSFKITYDKASKNLVIDREKSLYKLDKHELERENFNKRYVKVQGDRLKLDIIVDISVIEIFVNDGEFTLSSNYYVGKEDVSSDIDTNYTYDLQKFDL